MEVAYRNLRTALEPPAFADLEQAVGRERPTIGGALGPELACMRDVDVELADLGREVEPDVDPVVLRAAREHATHGEGIGRCNRERGRHRRDAARGDRLRE